jgi:hypothetical protein
MVRLAAPLSIWEREPPSPPELVLDTGLMDATSKEG